MTKKEQLKQMRKAGLTYQEMGNAFGISRQRVHQLLTGYRSPEHRKLELAKKKKRGFLSIFKKEKIVYVGLKYLSGLDFITEKIRQDNKWTCQSCKKKWKEGQKKFDVVKKDGTVTDRVYSSYRDKSKWTLMCHKCNYQRIKK